MNRLFHPYSLLFFSLICTSQFMCPASGSCQDAIFPVEKERSLKHLFAQTLTQSSQQGVISMADSFAACFYNTLKDPGSFRYPFDSLPTISKLLAPQENFRLYTWNIPLHDGSQQYYGILQIRESGSGEMIMAILRDNDTPQIYPDTIFTGSDNWFGAVYYQLVPVSLDNGRQVFTLLGWHGENRVLSGKVIDILWFNQEGEPVFGYPIFYRGTRPNKYRMIFWHSARTSMVLRYEEQYRLKSHKRFKKEFMIVCDRLIPEHPQLEGHYEYYIPSGELMDGFVFENHCWTFIPEVEVRNPGKK